ncbi:TonB-dependent receptor plug domain-containing protein [Tsuneonella amylolytica]|uniref:TonB-dependent receptor plug domain-containing protein n=1 Tax=Tsuneonella amylolytica TaxID=2338327 RepID=UPI000EAA1DE6|nr:TonB-dependent receptor [Tsuneonella amylolytica]
MKSPLRTVSIRRSGRGRLACGTALAGVAALGLFAAPAAAQTLADEDEPVEPSTETIARSSEEILVTGSRVARLGFDSPTPLTVISTEQIQAEAPTNNLFDLVNQLPSVAGSSQLSNSRLNISSGISGINTINLRNLGLERTLVLLDGKRTVPSTVQGYVDVNTFPQQLVSRVEVVTGGASAAYGSDAVAGVVNFVLDKRYDGLKLSANSGITDKGDGFTWQFSAAGGTSFAGGRGHVLLSGQLSHQDGIFQVDRDWNFGVPQIIGNPNYTATNGAPQFIVVGPGNRNNSTPGGIINASRGGTANILKGIYFGQGGSINRYNYGTYPSAGTISIGGDYLVDDTNRRIGLGAEEDRRNAFGRLSFDVTPWATAFVEASYNWQETLFNAGPQFFTSTSSGPLANIPRDNAFLQQTLGSLLPANVTSVAIGTTLADVPYRKLNNTRDVQRYVGGLEGTFEFAGKPAIWDAYIQYGETNSHEQLRDIIKNTEFANAVDAVFAPAGNAAGLPAGSIVCRSTLTNPTNGCIPLNVFGRGVANPASFGYFLGDPYRDQTLKQTVAGVNLSLTPFATWAGDVSVAVGGEYRKEEVSGFVPTEFQGGFQVGNYVPTFGDYNVKEAYLETVVPLGLGLIFNGAVRATDYSTSGYVTTYKVGATWQPIEDIKLRGTYSRDIRAPNLNELFQAGSSNTSTLLDGTSYRAVLSGNLDLEPEVSKSLTAGVVLTPRFIPGLSASVDYYRVKIGGAIGAYGAQAIFDRCQEGVQQFCNAYGPDPDGVRDLFFRASFFNFNEVLNEGIDFDVSYRLPLDGVLGMPDSSLAFRAVATHYLESITDDGISVPVSSLGTLSGSGPPDWLYRGSISLQTPDFGLTAIGRGVSSGLYSATRFECTSSCPASTALARTTDNNSIDGVFYVDLNATAKIAETMGGDAEVFFHVTNLFDADPIILPETGLAANSTYSDLLGRTFRVGVRLEF